MNELFFFVNKESEPIGTLATSLVANAVTARWNHRSVVVGDKMFIFGGSITNSEYPATASLESYNFKTGEWKAYPTGPTARTGLGMVTDGSKIYVFTGWSGGGSNYYRDLWAFDISTETWQRLADMPTAALAPAAAYYNGKIYSYGGWNGSRMNNLYVYDIASNIWRSGDSGPYRRNGISSAQVGSKLYMYGGNDENLYPQLTKSLWCLDMANESYEVLPDMPVATSAAMMTHKAGKLITIGGLNSQAIHSYDIATREIEYLGNLDLGIIWTTTINVYNGKHYFFGGGRNSAVSGDLNIIDI